VESESEGILGGVGIGKNVPIPTPTSSENLYEILQLQSPDSYSNH
jgi:hypothetical protein